MKKSLLTAVAVSAMALAVSQASAADYSAPAGPSYVPYVSIFAGMSLPNDVNTTRSGSDLSQTLENSYLVGGAFGMSWNNVVRTEVELSHSHWGANSFSTDGIVNNTYNSDVSATYLMGNVWLDLKNDSAFTPYVGGGLGVAFVNFDQSLAGGHGYSGNDTVLAYQLGAGVNFALSDQLSLDVGYRYKASANFNIQDGDGSSDFTNAHLGSHNVQVGLTYKF
jgi:opacity protein-like surface antigen